MDVREKLVELLDIIIQPGQKTLGDIADYLIANGVTVQEWISVEDRLPEDDSDVLAYSRNGEEGRIYPANYFQLEDDGLIDPKATFRWSMLDDDLQYTIFKD